MSFATIRQAIFDEIDDNATLIQNVYASDKSTFEGFPCVVVSPSENEADYGSSMRDRLLYVFNVRIYYPIYNESEQESADLAIEACLDELMSLFKTRGVLGTACDWVRPVPSAWSYEAKAETTYRVVTLKLMCEKHVSNL